MESIRLTPLKAIRGKCLECAGSPREIKACSIPGCPLFFYRMGKNPARKGIGGNPALIFNKVAT
jgi:hypothetical protein